MLGGGGDGWREGVERERDERKRKEGGRREEE